MDRIISLRAHHLLCICTFSGTGYSAEFTSNMRTIVDACRRPGQRVALVEGSDDVCAPCPHHAGSICNSDDERAALMDRFVHTALGVETGGIYRSLPLIRRV